MGVKSIFDRRTMLAAFGGAAMLGTLGSKNAGAEESKPDGFGFTTDEAELPKEKMGGKKPSAKPKTVAAVEVVPYHLLGGPIVFHGEVYVHKPDNSKTTTQGEVSKGPPPIGGLFEGYYDLSKADPDAYFIDNPLGPLNALQVRLILQAKEGYVVFRRGYKRIILPGWRWGPWHVLVTW